MASMTTTVIVMTDEDREKWEKVLFEYYTQKGETEANIPIIINEVFASAQSGWKRAPRDLDTRIKMKSGYQWKSHANLKPRTKDIDEPVVQQEDGLDIASDSIYSFLRKEEKAYLEQRIETYKDDFEFNNSSDKPLMDQLLVEEIIQRRLFKLQLKSPNQDYSKRLNDSLKRVADIQTKLGITREQRAGIMNKIDGNVAQLAQDLNEKLEKMNDIELEQLKEELYYENIKKQTPPLNMLPDVTKIEALLKVDGKVSTNVDSEKISVITETVAKEIKNAREKKPPKKDLAVGIDISQ